MLLASLQVLRACLAAQILEELLDLWPGVHEECLSVRLLRLEALLEQRNGLFSLLHESCLVLCRLLAIKCSIDRGVAMRGGDVGLMVIGQCFLLRFQILGPAAEAIGAAFRVSALAYVLQLEALGLPLFLASLTRACGLLVLSQALEEVLWAIALILLHH